MNTKQYTEEIMEGTLARINGDSTGDTNPYADDQAKHNAWMFGWRIAADQVQVIGFPHV